MRPLVDRFGRTITYLRVSVTDRCNQRCNYCSRPQEEHKKRDQLLSFSELVKIITIMAEMGVEKIRFTGGEPLVRKGITELVGMVNAISGIRETTLTTNATLLSRFARGLKDAGLKRVNISLDTLNPEKFRLITGGGRLEQVFDGIESALREGLVPVKLNTVVMRGINDDELASIIDFAQEHGLTVRFIECMPMRDGFDWKRHYMPIHEVLEREDIKERVAVEESAKEGGAEYMLPLRSGRGMVGFISPLSKSFCRRCNRLRLTADGRLHLCLPQDKDVSLRDALRAGADKKTLEALIRKAVELKPEEGVYTFSTEGRKKSMIHIGG